MTKIDMTPTGVSWQKTDSFAIREMCDKSLFEIAQMMNDYIEQYGPDAKLTRMGADHLAVEKFLPTYTQEQSYHMLVEWSREFDRKAAENVKQRADALRKKKANK